MSFESIKARLTNQASYHLKAATASFGRVLGAIVLAMTVAAREAVTEQGFAVLTSPEAQHALQAAVIGALGLTVANWFGSWNKKFGPGSDGESGDDYEEPELDEEALPDEEPDQVLEDGAEALEGNEELLEPVLDDPEAL